jgi:predicted Rossmann-fold nucleotide-binding protein
MQDTDLPFQPIRSSLYSSAELLSGFRFEDPRSLADTPDFRCYQYFVKNGRAVSRLRDASMMQALHDNSILVAMWQFLLAPPRRQVVAIMGGASSVVRGDANYVNTTRIAAKLSDAGFLVASGGGPGAMEATHLGALLAGMPSSAIDDAIGLLAQQKTLPNGLLNVVDKEGEIKWEILEACHKWAEPAVKLMRQYPDGGQSLGVPTWHYGHEPLSPLASHVSKYFANSIREDVLLGLAANGIVFMEGRAGTMQEVFQDAAQNYYASDEQPFAPMVFFGKAFWCEKLGVHNVLNALFTLGGPERKAKFDALSCFTDDIDEVVEFLKRNRPSDEQRIHRLDCLGFAGVMQQAARTNVALVAGLDRSRV